MKCKKTIDARRYSHAMLEQLRRDSVKRVESGESAEIVAKGLGINRRTIYRWLEAYHYGGDDALSAKPIPGAPPKLNARQMSQLAGIIRDKNPQQLQFEFALWTVEMVGVVIKRQFGVSLTRTSVGRLLKRLGFTPQRPLYRAWQQDPALVDNWLMKEYPAIVKRAKRENAVVFFADEAGIRSDHHAGTTWAPIGQTPVVKATGARYGFNMLSAVSAQGHFRFMTVNGSVNAGVFRNFLQRLITGMDRKVILIVDGHPTHKAKLVKQFIKDNARRLELCFLPAYSPELNPDELVWSHVKTRVAKAATQSREELKDMVERTLHRLQKLPHIVASFFHAPTCRYAM